MRTYVGGEPTRPLGDGSVILHERCPPQKLGLVFPKNLETWFRGKKKRRPRKKRELSSAYLEWGKVRGGGSEGGRTRARMPLNVRNHKEKGRPEGGF